MFAHVSQVHVYLAIKKKATHVTDVLTLSGEDNAAYHQDKYNCSFPAMIDDWRMAFHQGSGGQTAIDFPFGFVQVCNCATLTSVF